MTAPADPVYATPTATEPPPRKAAYDREDVVGWAMLAVVLGVGLIWLFSPFKVHSIVLSVCGFVTVIYLMAKDAITHRQHPSLWVFGGILFFPATFLLLMHERKRWGATWLLPWAAVSLVAVIAGVVVFARGGIWGPAARVTVSCRAAGTLPDEGYFCTPRHVGGYQGARACWDLSLTCENEAHLVEHVCAQVNLGEAREALVPFEFSPGVADCDKVSGASVDNLKVEVDPR